MEGRPFTPESERPLYEVRMMREMRQREMKELEARINSPYPSSEMSNEQVADLNKARERLAKLREEDRK